MVSKYKRTYYKSTLLRSMQGNKKNGLKKVQNVDKLIWLDFMIFLQRIAKEADSIAKDEGERIVSQDIMVEAYKTVMEDQQS